MHRRLLIGVAVFSAICACGASLALVATYNRGGGGRGPDRDPFPSGGGGSGRYMTGAGAAGSSPRHRSQSHFSVKYLCEPKLLSATGTERGGKDAAGAEGESSTALMAAAETSGSEVEAGGLPRTDSSAALLSSFPPTPECQRQPLVHGTPVLGCALASSLRSRDMAAAMNVLSDLESASDREEMSGIRTLAPQSDVGAGGGAGGAVREPLRGLPIRSGGLLPRGAERERERRCSFSSTSGSASGSGSA